MYAIGQEVMVTITDRRNSHSPVTVVRGVIVNGTKQIAKIVDKHPVWHGCEIASSPSVRIQRDWNSKPRTAEAESLWRRWGVVEHPRGVRCERCRTSNFLATPEEPHTCLHCQMKNVQLLN
jgi:hypothetical protein